MRRKIDGENMNQAASFLLSTLQHPGLPPSVWVMGFSFGVGVYHSEYTKNNKNRTLGYPTVTPVTPPQLHPDRCLHRWRPHPAGVPSIVSKQKEGV